MWPRLPRGWLIILLFAVILHAPAASQWHKDGLEEVRCPGYIGNAPCECVAASDGLDFTCASDKTGLDNIRAVVSAARFAIKTLVVTQLDPNTTVIPEKTFANGSVNDFTIQASSLSDIEDAAFEGTHQRLHTLTIHNSPNLVTVPRAVSKVSSLKRLDLSNNAIAEIYAYTFFGPSKLSFLNLESNRLTGMAENAFLGLENNLRELNLKDNAFESFPMSAVKILKKLQSLNLAGNRISNITIDQFTRLESIRYLDMNHNRFAYLSKETFSSMPSLQRLWLADNRIEDIEAGSLASLHDLETLDLSGNSLTDVPRDIFAQTRRLTSVNLSKNRLKSLAGVFVDLYGLEEVFLNDNLLLTFTSEWFANTPNLRVIHLEHNVLVEIGENALQPLKRLAQLYLSHNFLNVIGATYFRYNQALTSLHLDNNHITSIDTTAFRGVPKLRALRLDNNNLRSINRNLFGSLTSLTELHLQDNKLTEIEPQAFSSLANLAHLDVTGNRMTKLEDIMMRYPSNLKALYLDHNRLTSFHRETFSGQTLMDVLSMTDNKLERIPEKVFDELINLFRLSLANNRISLIEDGAFSGLPRVRFLDMRNNRLGRLTNKTLSGLQQVEVVDLSYNRIASIQAEAFSGFHHIRELDLSHNRLRTLKSGAFRGCLTLRSLKLSSSSIQFIEAHALDDLQSNLVELDLRDNHLVMPNAMLRLVKSLSKVKRLLLSGNDLRNLTKKDGVSFASMTKLDHLELERCSLSNVTSSLWIDNLELKVVKLGGNNLTSLPEGLFAKQIFLQELHLDRNKFKSVPNEAMKYLYHLSVLNMSGNVIEKLQENSFDHVGALQTLDLSANNMKAISERAFHNVTRLQELILEHNLLQEFYSRTFLPLAELATFRARGNAIPFIPVAVMGMRSVSSLDFSVNKMERLKEIPESRAVMKSVTTLKITKTNLTTISPSDLDLVPHLTHLDLSLNRLSRVAPYAFRALTSLLLLDLSQNEIMHLSRERFSGLSQLQYLNLSRNHLISLDVFPADLSTLVVLDLSHNRIRSLARDSLSHLTGLVRLDLRGNLLSEILPEVLHPMPSIKALELADNSFSVLPLDGLQAIEDTLESVSFKGNPLICSCQSYVQKIWLRQHRKWLGTEKRGSKVGPQCTEPTPIHDRYLLTVKDSELCPLPSVNSLQLSSIKPYSFLLTWDSPDTNMTGLKGFIVAYHRLDTNDQVKKFRLPPAIRGFKIEQVLDSTLYLVCVVTRGSSWRGTSVVDETENRIQTLQDEQPGLNNYYDDEEEEDAEYDIEALESLGLLRTERSSTDDSVDVVYGEDYSNALFAGLPEWMTSSFSYGNGTNPTEDPTLNYPSSNDTNLMVHKPMIVNLGSKSSKCTEIKTPVDPAKLRFIDNKRMSIIIGCTAGILVFIFIIASIVMNREDKDDEVVEEESLEGGSHKSPGSKTNRSDSLSFAPKANNLGHHPRGMSRNNSQSSSLHNNRMSIIEPSSEAGPRGLRNNPNSASLKRSGTLSRQQSRENPQQQQLQGSSAMQKQYSSSAAAVGGRLIKQSSTESGPSSSNPRLSRQSSSETTGGGGGGRGMPTPRRSMGGGAELNSHTSSLPRSGTMEKRRGGGGDSAIPLIEYSLVEADGGGHYSTVMPDAARSRGGGTGARPKVSVSDNRRSTYDHANHVNSGGGSGGGRMGNHVDSEAAEAEESMDYYPDTTATTTRTSASAATIVRNNNQRSYVKYNSFANY